MQRDITNDLAHWKNSSRRKPLLLTGVRQCGKTWALKDFGERFFSSTVYLNFEENEALSGLFEHDFDVERISREIAIYTGSRIIEGETLLILDEIQECPRAITSLKYFCENKRGLHVACAGSLLGVALKREDVSFPVGKVNRLRMAPLSFREFAAACGADEQLSLLATWPADRVVPVLYSAPLERLLKEYYIVGGMPEAVSEWRETHDLEVIEEVQAEILQDYADDFAKHAPANQIEKIRWVWSSVPKQLAKENNKFVFSHVKAGKRAAELEDAVQWLADAGMIMRLELVENPQLPLSSAADATYFKAYLCDVGLLRKLAGLSARTVLDEAPLYQQFKGALAENYVLNELRAQGQPAYFWRSGNTAEVDLITEFDGRIVPMEVKSADNTQAKSYRQFCKRYAPEVGFKLSLKNIGQNPCEGTLTISLPLWMAWNWKSYLDASLSQVKP